MSDEKCSICKEFMNGIESDYMLSCNHRFHTECIVNSLRKNSECPVCRDKGIDDIDNDEELFELYSPWQQNIHDKNCLCCASKDPESDYYDIYQMIKIFGKEHHNDLLKEYKINHSKVVKCKSELLHQFNNQNRKIQKICRRYNELMYRNMGNSPQLNEYKEANNRLKITKNKLKNSIQKEFADLGYDTDKEFIKLINEFIKNELKWRSNWRFKKLINNIQRFTLPKYAPKEGESFQLNTINDLGKNIEI